MVDFVLSQMLPLGKVAKQNSIEAKVHKPSLRDVGSAFLSATLPYRVLWGVQLILGRCLLLLFFAAVLLC